MISPTTARVARTSRRARLFAALAASSVLLTLGVSAGLLAPPAAAGAVPTDHDYMLAFSAYDYHGTSLYAVRADGTDGASLTPADTAATDAAWAPDGRHIAYSHKRSTTNPSIVIIDANGGNAHALIAGSVPAWAPDSSRLAYTAPDGIETINPDGSNRLVVDPTPTTGSHTCPAYSPDGTMIVSAFADYDAKYGSEGHHELRIVRADGRGVVGSYNTSLSDLCANWSADSKQLVFSYAGHITTIHADATSPRVLTNTPCAGDTSPHWSHDGTKISFARAYPHPAPGAVTVVNNCPQGGTDAIWTVTPDAAQLSLLHAGPGFDAIWSPDDRLLAYTTTGATGTNCTNCTYAYINIVHADGTGYHQLPGGGGAATNTGPTFAPLATSPPGPAAPTNGPGATPRGAPGSHAPALAGPNAQTAAPTPTLSVIGQGPPDAPSEAGSKAASTTPITPAASSGAKPRHSSHTTSRLALGAAITLTLIAAAAAVPGVRSRVGTLLLGGARR